MLDWDNPYAAHGFSWVLNILHLLNTCASYEVFYPGDDVVKFDKVIACVAGGIV